MKICVIYASMTGNTEDIAAEISQEIKECVPDAQIDKLEMEGEDAEVLLQYDGILLGSYTWGDGELPFEAEDFYDQFDDLDLNGKVVGCFGSGDHAYPHFCAAVDIFQQKVKECGADVLQEGLKVELAPEDPEDISECRAFGRTFVERLKGITSWAG